jgi:selenocysteine lyase/cysteine desulfurase
VRLSFHLYNDEEDVELAVSALGPAGIAANA